MTIVYQTVTAGNVYSRTINAPNTIYFAAENLPQGLSINQEGVISGELQQAGRFAITILARGAGGTGAAVLDLTVTAPPTPFITSVDAVTHETTTAFSYQITASSPTAILSYGATNLPTGLSVNTGTGFITGTPTTTSNDPAVTITTTVSATNAVGTGNQNLILTLAQRPVITSSLTPLNFNVGAPITPYTITATKSPISFSASPLPPGLSINTGTGVISGTPTLPGNSQPQLTSTIISAYNGYFTTTQPLNITVGYFPTITSALSITDEAGTTFSYQITASSPSAILSYGATNLPTGLSVDTGTGFITGTPTSASNDPAVTVVIPVSATNIVGTTSQNVTLALTQRPVVTSSLTPLSSTNTFSITPYTITASKSPTSFAATNLPSGLSISSSTGVISGTANIPVQPNVVFSFARPGKGKGARLRLSRMFNVEPAFYNPEQLESNLTMSSLGNIFCFSGSLQKIFPDSSVLVSNYFSAPNLSNIKNTAINLSETFVYVPTFSPSNAPTDIIIRKASWSGLTPGTFTDFVTVPNSSSVITKPVLDSSDNIYCFRRQFASSGNTPYELIKISPAGNITFIAGGGTYPPTSGIPIDGTGNSAVFSGPADSCVDSSGNIYVFDRSAVRKVTQAGVVTTLAGIWETGYVDGTGLSARFGGTLTAPYTPRSGICVSSSGNIFVADSGSLRIRKVTQAGVVTTLAGGISGAGDCRHINATGSAARFYALGGIVCDSLENLFVADQHEVRKITQAGVVTTFSGYAGNSGYVNGNSTSARFYFPVGIVADSSSNVYVADRGNYVIRKIDPSGNVSTFAGDIPPFSPAGLTDGTGTAARLNLLSSIYRDSSNNIYLDEDSGAGSDLRKITPSGVVTTLPDDTVSPLVGRSDSSGNNYITTASAIGKLTPSGVFSVLAGSQFNTGYVDGTGSAARFSSLPIPRVTPDNIIYVNDFFNRKIRRCTTSGVVTTFFDNASIPNVSVVPIIDLFELGPNGDIYATVDSDLGSTILAKIAHPSGSCTVVYETARNYTAKTQLISGPSLTGSFGEISTYSRMTIAPDGSIYLTGEHVISKISSAGILSFIGGTGLCVDTTFSTQLTATNSVLTSNPASLGITITAE